MKISRNWLSDFVDFDDLSPERFVELITTRVAEVDSVFTAASPLDQALAAVVKKVSPHPSKANLKISLADIGGTEVSVVCGAPNCREGMLTAYVPPGACIVAAGSGVGEEQKLIQVEEREISGVKSCGVFLSEAELGLSGEHQGIIELNQELLSQAVAAPFSAKDSSAAIAVEPGAKLSSVFGPPDTILEIDNKSLTHRPDLWSHFGFARELSAILHRPLKFSCDELSDYLPEGAAKFTALGNDKAKISIKIAPDCGCRRFAALELRGIKVSPSPLWIRRRLFSVGAGVRNLIVDLSNYVMHDLGQPNHTYDADKLAGQVIEVRCAAEGEKFFGLDGEERSLSSDDIVIADAQQAVALGGVIGGGPSAVSDSTTRLLLESANFNPVCIRTTTKRHQLRTDASNRFEKSQSAFAVPLAIQRYSEMLCRLLPGAHLYGKPADCFPERPKSVFVPLRFNYIRERLGSSNSDQEISEILNALGFRQSQKEKGLLQVEVPYYRATRDISIEDDLVEEVGRIYVYENIPENAPKIESVAAKSRPLVELERGIEDTLRGAGFSEVYQYSFMNSAFACRLGYQLEQAISLQNPVDSASGIIRTTLVPSMLELLQKNRRYFSALQLYELGRVYESQSYPEHEQLKLRTPVKRQAAHERRLLCLAYASGKEEQTLAERVSPVLSQGADFYALLTVLRRICCLRTPAAIEAVPLLAGCDLSRAGDFLQLKPWMHPRRAASLKLKDSVIGVLAEVSPLMLQDFNGRAVIAEIDLELLLEADQAPRLFSPLPKYPDSFFEMSVVMPRTAYYSSLKELITANVDSSILRRIEVLAVYQGPPLSAEEKSVSVKLFLGADDRTLSGEELSSIQQRLVEAVQSSSFSLRV